MKDWRASDLKWLAAVAVMLGLAAHSARAGDWGLNTGGFPPTVPSGLPSGLPSHPPIPMASSSPSPDCAECNDLSHSGGGPGDPLKNSGVDQANLDQLNRLAGKKPAHDLRSIGNNDDSDGGPPGPPPSHSHASSSRDNDDDDSPPSQTSMGQMSGPGGMFGGMNGPGGMSGAGSSNMYSGIASILSALAPIALGGLSAYSYAHSIGSYYSAYNGYLSQCTAIGITCSAPTWVGGSTSGYGNMSGSFGRGGYGSGYGAASTYGSSYPYGMSGYTGYSPSYSSGYSPSYSSGYSPSYSSGYSPSYASGYFSGYGGYSGYSAYSGYSGGAYLSLYPSTYSTGYSGYYSPYLSNTYSAYGSSSPYSSYGNFHVF
jgi:hypothetical protein